MRPKGVASGWQTMVKSAMGRLAGAGVAPHHDLG